MTKRDIFISYKTEDFETASWVRSVLETNGVSCWMAPADIPGGSSYAVEIPLAIQGCVVFVVILSERAQESKWIPKELDQAINLGKVVMPFMLENVPLKDDFNFYLSNVQRYAAYESKTQAIEKMLREIRAVLNVKKEEAEIPPPPAQTASSRPRRRVLWAALMVAVLGLLIGGGLLLFRGKDAPAAYPAPIPTPAEEPAPLAMHRVTISPSVNMSIVQYNAAVSAIRERVETLVGSDNFGWTPQDEDIELRLPEDAFCGMNAEYVFRCYLTRPMDLFLQDMSNRGSILALSREDMEEVVLLEGAPEEIDAGKLGIQAESYPYLRITLKEDYAQANRAAFSAYTTPVLALDLNRYNDYCIFYLFPAPDGRTLYLTDADFTVGNFAKTAYYNLTHEPLPEGFFFSASLDMQTAWQTPGGSAAGKNQVTEEEITAASVIYSLAVGKRTAGEQMDTEAILKARLDSIGVPYAYGTIGNRETGLNVVFKIDAAHMSPALTDLLAEPFTLAVRGGMSAMKLYFSDLEVVSDADTAPGFTLRIKAGSYSRDQIIRDLNTLIRRARDAGEEYLTLGAQGSYSLDAVKPLFCIALEDITAEGDMPVKAACTVENNRPAARKLTEEEAWLGALLSSALTGDKLPGAPHLETYQYGLDASGAETKEEQTALYLPYDRASIQTAAAKVYRNAFTSITDRSLYVFLQLPVDEGLAADGPVLAQKMYEALDFPSLAFDTLYIILADEDNSAKERARIYFTKNYQPAASEQDGSISVSALLINGRMDAYGPAFTEKVNSMDFYGPLMGELTYWNVAE